MTSLEKPKPLTSQDKKSLTLREEELRPRDLAVEQARLFSEDITDLMAFSDEFKEASCPACGAHSQQPAFEKTGLTFVSCSVCETVFASPRPQPEHLERYYRTSRNYAFWSKYVFPASESARREKVFRPRVELVLDVCRRFELPMQTLLEVGAGFGIFCEEMKKTQAFQRIVAIEPTPDLAVDCRQRGLNVIEKPIEQVEASDLQSGPHPEPISVIASFEVIEHLFEPRQFIHKCHQLLQANGVLILSCPNVKGFDIQALGPKSIAVDIEHINLFHPASLKKLLESCGFEVLDIQTPGRLDAELVRAALLSGELDPADHPFYRQILLDNWTSTGAAFQEFLIQNRLSSHMLVTARKK
jgi:2-polyprenyl-3-methyl-5-hydroxy-6-metoxy-1,4-benzoquinol methylase